MESHLILYLKKLSGGLMENERVLSILQRHTVSQSEIMYGDRIESDLGLCSFDMMLIVYEIEEELHKTIDFRKLHSDMTVKEFLAVIG